MFQYYETALMPIARLLLISLILLGHTAISADSTDVPATVSTSWLAKNIDNVIILDVRTSKKSFITPAKFKAAKDRPALVQVGGHIPKAQLIIYSNIRGEQLIAGKTIKYMIIPAQEFQKIMQNSGVNKNSHIIVTSNAETGYDLTMATRLIWQLKYFGHENVSLLDGGTAQWIIDGREVTTSLDTIALGNWVASKPTKNIFADSEDTMNAIEDNSIQIVDVRPLGQYLGVYKSSKATKKGHIPTAKVFPVDLLSSRDLPVKFLSNKELEQISVALSIDSQSPLITYCNSGHMASGAWFVFHELLENSNTQLFDGSMHQWTHENKPVVSMIVE